MVRLMLILAPAAAILTALAIDNLLIPYAYSAHGRIKLTKTTMSMPSIGGQNAAGSYVTVFALMLIMVTTGINTAGDVYTTPELTPGNSPADAITDWLEAFDWMKTHTNYKPYAQEGGYSGLKDGQPPAMLSWWDYGYYITQNGETATLADNATHNSTQIGVVGTMLMWNASEAIKLMYMYNVQHVLVVPAGGNLNLGSDLGKSIWMIRIAEQYTKQFGIVEEDYYQPNSGYVDKYYQSVLFQLMSYQADDMVGTDQASPPPFVSDKSLEGLLKKDFRSHAPTGDLEYFTEVFRSTGLVTSLPGDYPMIRIFHVDYPDDIELQVNEFKEYMNM